MPDFARDPLVLRMMQVLVEQSHAITPDEKLDWLTAALAIVAAEQRWYYVMQLCLPALFDVPVSMREDIPDIDDEHLLQVLIFGHRINDALRLKLHGREAIASRIGRDDLQLPARRWNLPWTDRWMSPETIREMFVSVRDTARRMPASLRGTWVVEALQRRCSALNARMLDGTDLKLARHAMATGSQWKRLTRDPSPNSIHVRIHYASGYLSTVLRVGTVTVTKGHILPLLIGRLLSAEERLHLDRHFALHYLSIRVFETLWRLREKEGLEQILPYLQWFYGLLLHDVLHDPRVQAACASHDDRPSLMVTTHGALAQLPFSALHDGERYLAERYDVLQASPIFPDEAFDVGELDLETATGGTPLRSLEVRVLVDDRSLPQAAHELDELRALDRQGLIELKELPNDAAQSWDGGTLQWLFQSRGVALLSAHMRASSANAREAVILTPDQRELALGQALSASMPVGLVLLAGCHSAGQTDWLAPGESSVVSLLRQAGAEAVISTFWPIEDYSARLYNVAVISALGGGQSRAAAHGRAQRMIMQATATLGQLQAGERLARRSSSSTSAQRSVTEQLAHPYYWAGFVLTGAWR